MAAWMTLVCLAAYFLGYTFYSRFLSRKIFSLDPGATTPAHALRDDIDYVPTNRLVLFGHHYASITGLAPMLGPAIAVIWGWLPAMVWVVCGALLVGCVHDFGALVVSMRARGMSIGKVAEGIIGPRAKSLFHIVIFFGVALAMGVFVIAIAGLFRAEAYPSAVLPSGGLMLVALLMGWILKKGKAGLGPVALGGFLAMMGLVWLGMRYGSAYSSGAWPGTSQWKMILLGYGFLASVLPVWTLLQPRDFVNSLLLYLGLLLMYLGIFVGQPEFAAPMIQANPEGAPSMFPFVFIVIACGAASGFHSLVSSGTTAKQINKETDARPIGYGGMIGESLLGLIAVLACTAGALSPESWSEPGGVYSSWSAIKAPGIALANFINGGAGFIAQLGIDLDMAVALVSVVVVSFALTTLDSATRLLRFNIQEIGQTLRLPVLGNRFLASLLAVGAIGFFAFFTLGGKPAGIVLWQLFGTTNQLLAGLALLTVTLYLIQRGRNPWFTGIPMAFMLISTLFAMFGNLRKFWDTWEEGGSALFVVGFILFILALWLSIEALLSLRRFRREGPQASLDIHFSKKS